MPTPSFILPSAPVYEEGTLYGLELYGSNFVPSPMSFTRATTATRVNSAGLVELVPYNLLQQSNTFNNAIWQLIGTPTITANYDTNPLTGENDAWRFQSSGNSQRIYQVLNNSFCTFSLYAKGSGIIRIRDSSSTHITTLTLTSSWQRFLIYIPASFTNVQISASTGGCDATIYGAQLVEGSVAKDYQKTETRLNIPRLDYSLGGCPNILLEPQRTNLVLQSSSFDSVSWLKSGLTITANQGVSPDGTQNADLLDDGTSVSTQHWIYQEPIFSNSTTYTISFYAKYVSRKNMAVNIYNGSTSQYVKYDIQNGVVVGSTGDVTASMTSVGNGWYRIVYTRTMAASGSKNFRIALADDTGFETYTGSNKQVYLWGAQVELGSYATSYIPTTTASVTRNQDVASKTGISSLIGQTEGVFYAEINGFLGDNTSRDISIYSTSFGTYNNYLRIQLRNITNLVRFTIIANGSSIRDFSTTVVQNNFNKIAVKYSQSGYSFWLNGVKVGDGVNACDFQLLDSFKTSSVDGSGPFNGNINSIQLYKTALTDDQLEALTGEGFNTYAEMASYYNYTLQ